MADGIPSSPQTPATTVNQRGATPAPQLDGSATDMQNETETQNAQPPAGPTTARQSPFEKYRQANYNLGAGCELAIAIRTASGATMGQSTTGRAHVIGDGKGRVNHVRFGENATEEQKAFQILAAGYAQTFSSDAEAYDAARQSAIDAGEDEPRGLGERVAAGFMSHQGKEF